MNRGHLLTEQINIASANLDQLSPLEIVDLFNQEDQNTIKAIANAREELAKTIEITAKSLSKGGRLFYLGAGTSGRLGVLDAAECPPTFCTPPDMVQGILAGGVSALVKSSEALEDRPEDGAQAMIDNHINSLDVVIGITAGGTTPYVHGALQEAKKRGAVAIAMSCVPSKQVPIEADIDIRLLTGAEILAGSTRLKAGTVTKMALNIISTGVMVKLGKVYGNRMIDVSVTNSKLEDRALRIISDLTDLDRENAMKLLSASGYKVKLALLMHWRNKTSSEAEILLRENEGNLRQSLNN
ncbi:MAG: N-acetylmuramic acid 6-phosphate etherase [Cyanobacteria bacterium]|uniref:N-acetylmuramic acid 6-phosphate etherase n=1 Tax=Geminocystis sp. TaxID=2664100 RepID=UPI001D4AEF70|nr:N-acetylmuramic acid 6-phosphate etherase [Cyanobacteria bacterium CG_2015-16_32_12]NCO77398.1 N-acetylmuramic acid 6-phosphate etherase [Cyanobacteria bacterium CG_2015-22_32_23]NCQ04353.1 N-acetylmuramic acid 6-phosphate etherase [Cyanobacteria bacterium CG_2015-09_32_10]NCQ42255.1 N-acetylmuramic acid 6-phosphate etherase [Cyanobacteria bacterium CG_2015-04_32_10]NCS83949.1 N-acetylmuramic acid 6-phosphate etherase [Cyanobacteria bacterium CG_2015-02_32_10]